MDIRCRLENRSAGRTAGCLRKNEGFTLIELVTVVVVMAILTTVGIPSFSNLITTTRVKSAASDLYIALSKARSEAIKRNANVTLSSKSGGWQNGWQILDPANTSIILDDHGAFPSGVTVTSASSSLVYLSSGRIQGTTAVSFLIGADTVNRCVSVDPSGRPYIKSSSC